jgi:hypothetical protein
MKRKNQNMEAPFQSVPSTSTITGLSQKFLRDGCKNGSIPHVKSGTDYYINVPALLRKLEVTQ